LIDLTEHVSTAVLLVPWAVSAVGRTVAQVHDRATVTPLRTISRLTEQLSTTGRSGTVSYRDRNGSRWTVEIRPAQDVAVS
jgi:phage pi2 protein 07